MKKVSIIIPCFNQEKFIEEALDSALAQTYENLEIVCIDDCSSDNSAEIINNYLQKHDNIKFIRNSENKGVVYSRNTAIKASEGEYILPLDGDDKIEPTYVEKAVKILDEHPEIGFVYCKAKYFGRKSGEWKHERYSKEKIIFANCIFNCALFRKSDFERLSGYNEEFAGGYEDWDLWLTFVENGLEPYEIDEFLFHYRKLIKKSRSKMEETKRLNLLCTLIKNHIKLYCSTNEFAQKVFGTSMKKQNKYKKLYSLFLIVALVELLVIIGFLIKLF